MDEDEIPDFITWVMPVGGDSEEAETAANDGDGGKEERIVFMRDDIVRIFLYKHLQKSDADRAWSKLRAEHIRAEFGDELAETFLEKAGVYEH